MISWLRRQITSAGYYFSSDAAHRKDIARITNRVLEIEEKIDSMHAIESSRLQLALAEEECRILSEVARRTSENIVLKGKKVFSQCDEDGIIATTFATLGGQKTFIEIGCGDGLENNTRLLLLDRWRGVWIDGSKEHIAHIESMLGGLAFPHLLVERQFIDIDNVCPLIERYCGFLNQREVDFFSLDIDGNELHVLIRSLDAFNPRIICVEYNAKFPPPLVLSIRYNASHTWRNDDYHGCSLMALVGALASRYTLLTCTLSGVNAFFVRNDLAHRFKIYPPEDLYQPARYHRVYLSSGHPNSPNWLRNVLADG